MKTIMGGMLLAAGLAASGASQASLVNRGGGLYYDTTLDVTWLQNSNSAGTAMTWSQATAWADGLNYFDSVRGVTWSDWRLPTTTDFGTPGCNFSYGGTDCGYNSTGSELAHMFFNNLGLKSAYFSNGTYQANHGLDSYPPCPVGVPCTQIVPPADIAPYNLQNGSYWSGTTDAGNGGHAWYFNFGEGYQGTGDKTDTRYAWAVRAGDVLAPVPEPEAYAMLIAGLGLISAVASRRRRSFSLPQ